MKNKTPPPSEDTQSSSSNSSFPGIDTANSEEDRLIHIIGIGNLTRFDDGIAIKIIQELEKHKLPSNVKVTDLGTGGIDIALLLDGWSVGIIIDAVQIADLEPGEIIEFEIQDENLPEIRGFSSSHGFDILSALKLAFAISELSLPERIIVIGIQVKKIEGIGLGLSPEVEKAIPKVIKRIEKLVRNYLE